MKQCVCVRVKKEKRKKLIIHKSYILFVRNYYTWLFYSVVILEILNCFEFKNTVVTFFISFI